MVAFGLAGLFADCAAHLPDPFADIAREKRGIIIAIITGIVYGAITIGMYIDDWRQDPNGPDGAWVHMALPWSIPFYTFGAIFLEYLLRLGALCILFWFVHVVLLRRRARALVFWVLAAIVALYEIMPYLMSDIQAGRWENLAHVSIEPLYLSNVFEG